MKLWLVLPAVALLFVAGVYGGVAGLSQARLEDYRAQWRREVAAEREREGDVRRPALRGEAVDQNAALRYERLIQVADHWSFPADLRERIGKTAAAGPPQPLAPDLARLLQVHQGALAELRDTFRHTRCDWQLDFDQGFSGQQPPARPIRLLADLLLLEGHELAPANWDAAAERYLGVTRLGTDLAVGSYLSMGQSGIGVTNSGLTALLRLLAWQAPAEPQALAAAATSVEQLGKALPAPADMFRRDRLLAEAALFNAAAVGGAFQPTGLSSALGNQNTGIFAVTPLSFYLARTFRDLDGFYRTMETAAAATDQATRAHFAQALSDGVKASWNPLIAGVLPNYYTALQQIGRLTAEQRLLSAGLALELVHNNANAYPATPANLPADPFAAAGQLHAQTSPYGYKLWSVGENGQDDAGAGDDILLERKGS